jgi:acetyl-CoA synthetase
MSIYHKYFKEYLDQFGTLVDFELNFPDNFNFAYDVVDEIAKEEPNKKALVWCNTENEEHIFTFEDIKDYSNKYANILFKMV